MDCPHCGKRILSEDIHEANRVARCRFCDEIFRTAPGPGAPLQVPPLPPQMTSEAITAAAKLEPDVEHGISRGPTQPVAGATVPSVPSILVCPARTWIEENDDEGPRIVFRQFGTNILGLIIVLVLWIAFCGCGSAQMYGLFFGDKRDPLLEYACLFFSLTVIFLGVLYCLLSYVMNRRVVSVLETELHVRVGPIPAGGNVTLDLKTVQQFYVHRVLHHGDSTTEYFEVRALLTDAGQKTVLSQLGRDEAQFYVEHLNAWLSASLQRNGEPPA